MTTNDRPTLITAEQLNRTCYGMEISSGFLSPAEEGENAGKRDNDRAEAEDGNFPFGQTEDGWNQTDLAPILEIIEDAVEVKYEIENCRRGSYIDGATNDDLACHLLDMAEALKHQARILIDKSED